MVIVTQGTVKILWLGFLVFIAFMLTIMFGGFGLFIGICVVGGGIWGWVSNRDDEEHPQERQMSGAEKRAYLNHLEEENRRLHQMKDNK